MDGSRPAGEDQPLRSAGANLGCPHVVRQQLREDAALANPARDQLRVLPAVVENNNFVVGHAGVELSVPSALDEGEAPAPRLPIPTPCDD
uniref:Unannotated protein n=1 Tax=freshwater metagenome TaxID=449393 RepID=A0A6J5ZPU7_9ZZZZ